MKKILVIGTGGTIASRQSSSGLVPILTAEELVSHVPDVANIAELDAIQVCNLDSTDIVPSDWLRIADAIREHYEEYDGFVVCHGTDTLAYTAAGLSYLIQNSARPIVITGSQKPIDAEDTDARRNLRDSICYAADEASSDVSIVFDGKVIAGTRAKKQKSKSFDAFSSVNFPNIAIIVDGRIIRYIQKPVLPGDAGRGLLFTGRGPLFAQDVSNKVFVLKLVPGMSPDILPVLFDRYDCLIIESFGVGGIPAYLMPEFRKQMEQHSTIVIVSTQVSNEGSNMSVYQVGHDVKEDYDLLETYDMTGESAFAKACWILGLPGITGEMFKRYFYTPIDYDLTY